MNVYIAELAGKDSVAAIHKFIRTHSMSRIIPTIVYTRTEYGGFDSYFKSLNYLKKYATDCGSIIEDVYELANEKFWNIFCVKYQYNLYQMYGFYTPCIMCHLYTHLLRIPLCYKFGAVGIITGERFFHGEKIKINQHPRTLDCFQRLIDYSGLKLIQPLVKVKNPIDIANEIEDNEILNHANDTKCILSGNLNGSIVDEFALQKFLDEYIYKTGVYIIDAYKDGKDISFKLVDQFIEGLF